MKITLYVLLFSFFFISAFASNNRFVNTNDDVYDLISSRIRAEAQADVNLDAIVRSVEEAKKVYREDGSFSDIEYGARNRTGWPPLRHITRLNSFTFAYTMPGNKYYKDENIYKMIHDGLSFWYDRNPHCNNWWYNQIAEPQRIGIILLQMQTGEKQLPDDLVTKTLERMRTEGGDPKKQTGPNKTDVALHWLYRACLTKDANLLSETMEQAFEPLRYTTGEGIQYDNSYFQHGRQLYVMGYGDELIKGVTKFAIYTTGTQFELDKDRLEIFDKFVRETYLKVIRGEYCHYNIMGRGMSRKDVTKRRNAVQFCKNMIILVPEKAKEYTEAIERLTGEKPAQYGIEPVSKVFFNGDYVLHVRPGFSFGVRTVSARTLRNEYGNGENLKTYFVSDGSTHIAAQGGEYYNIFPVWNWSRIPGVTAPQTDTIPRTVTDWQTPGTSLFTGGVSDSLYSAYTYVYDDKFSDINTSAKKSWFFFDEEVVCLGSGITSASRFPVNTTVNQSLLQGDVLVSEGNIEKVLTKGDYELGKKLNWILHNGFGYVFPQKGNINLSFKETEGSWRSITQGARNAVEKKDVFTLWVDHGTQPQQATYAYIVVPDKHTAKEMNAYDTSNISILANNSSMQIVQNKKLDMWQMIFFEPGEFSHQGTTIKVDAPCAVLLKNIKTNPVVHIADPAQKQGIINLEMNISGKSKRIVCDFTNTEVYAGKSKSYKHN